MMQQFKRFIYICSLGFLISFVSACSSGGGGNASGGAAQGSDSFFIINSVQWGRLVDVFDLNGELLRQNIVIEPDILSDATYVHDVNSLTDKTTVAIQFPQGTEEFAQAFAALDDNLPTITPKSNVGFGGGEPPPPFPNIPRDAALKINFNNAVQFSTVNANTVSIFQGSPPETPYLVRYVIAQEEPKALILDPTISAFDAANEGGTANLAGYQPGISDLTFNLKLSIPSKAAGLGGFVDNLLLDQNDLPLTTTSAQVEESGNIIYIMRSSLDQDSSGEFLADTVAPKILGVRQVNISTAVSVGSKRQLTYTFTPLGTADCSLTPGVGDIIVQGSGFGVIASGTDIVSSTSPFIVNLTPLQETINAGLATTRHIYNDANDSGKKACLLEYSVDLIDLDLSTPLIGVDPSTQFTINFTKPLSLNTAEANDTIILGTTDTGSAMDPFAAADGTDGGNYYGLNTGPSNLSSLVPIQIVTSFDQKSFTVSPFRPLKNNGGTNAGNASLTDDAYYLHIKTGDEGLKGLGGSSVPEAPISPGTGGDADFEISTISPSIPSVAGNTFSSSGIALRFNELIEDGTADAENNVVITGQIVTANFGEIHGRAVQHFSRLVAQGLTANPRTTMDFMTSMPLTIDPFTGLIVVPQAWSDLGVTSPPTINPVYPVNAPLKSLGARVMMMWRYVDMGLGTGDIDLDGCIDNGSEFNLDVEGLNWMVDGGQVFSDRFSKIEMTLGHSRFSPDEVNTFGALVSTGPAITGCYDKSGLLGGNLVNTFNDNFFESTVDPNGPLDPEKFGPKVVYSGEYVVDPNKAFDAFGDANANTKLVPFPDFGQTFCWRDNTIVNEDQADSTNLGKPFLGAPNANGWEPDRLCELGGFLIFNPNPPPGFGPISILLACALGLTVPVCQDQTATDWDAPSGWTPISNSKIKALGWPPTPPNNPSVPSIGLPLLLDFKTFPDINVSGVNQFRAFQATAFTSQFLSGSFERHPFFRILSVGAAFSDGSTSLVNPATETMPRGERDPAMPDAPPQQAGDDVVYGVQADLVTKKAVAFTRWFDTGSSNPTFRGVIIEPTAEQLASLGVSLELTFRGSTSHTAINADSETALMINPYGNVWDTACGGLEFDPTTNWKDDITDLNDEPSIVSVQVRIIFHGNATTNVQAYLNSLQISWDE